MSLGIIPELEYDCMLQPGEFVVFWVDRSTEMVGIAVGLGDSPCATWRFDCLRTRSFMPVSGSPSPGDIVRVNDT